MAKRKGQETRLEPVFAGVERFDVGVDERTLRGRLVVAREREATALERQAVMIERIAENFGAVAHVFCGLVSPGSLLWSLFEPGQPYRAPAARSKRR